ncbi:MAG TPA: MFS transporter, partial [Burkholderiales bacterium]|nr:MFS transporter [Burkholderiales bacterium]
MKSARAILTSPDDAPAAVTSDVPGRLDALPWSRWHWRVVLALGVSWLLDGLEVTVVGAIGPSLQRPETLGLSAAQIGWAASAYIAGAVAGALVFGRLADRLGRKRMFLATLAVYLVATILTGFSFDLWSFALCRFLTGFGIGGEYAAINSAIDELIPARVRGAVDLAINGSFWIGAMIGAALSIVLLDPAFVRPEWGWRLAFLLGGALAFAILVVRRHVPESPRWLLRHGRVAEAEAIVAAIEAEVGFRARNVPTIAIRPVEVRWADVLHTIVVRYTRRAILGLSLMATQAFFYNAIFFTYALVLSRFFAIPDERVGYYIFPFALGNFLGPLVLGRLFDTWGRRVMISLTYAGSGLGLFATGYLFAHELLGATGLALAWSAIFFVASAAASSAYLTVSEIFPVEIRAVSISLFYAAGTTLALAGPPLYGAL